MAFFINRANSKIKLKRARLETLYSWLFFINHEISFNF